MCQCENIRFINSNIFKNFEHVYRRHPFDVLLPLRANGFIAFSITINTTQFPFKKICRHRVWIERKRARENLFCLSWLVDTNDEDDGRSYIRKWTVPMRECLYLSECMTCIRLNMPNLLGNPNSLLVCPYEPRCNCSVQ